MNHAKFFIAIGFAIFVICYPAHSAEPALTVKLFDEAADRIFKVGVADSISAEIKSHGTGFAVSEDGLVATAYHVVDSVVAIDRIRRKSSQVYVIRNGIRMRAVIWAVDAKNDFAILKVPVKLPKPWLLSGKGLKKGSALFLLGYPGPAEFSIVSGLLQSSTVSKIIPTYQITSPVTGGMSGGPVINESGEVVGVTLAAYAGGGDISLAGQGAELEKLLARAKMRRQEPEIDEIRLEADKGYFDLQNQLSDLLSDLFKNRSEFHGWMLPSATKVSGDVACKEWDLDVSDDDSSLAASRECEFKMTREGDEVSFSTKYFAIKPRSNQFKTANLSNSLANSDRFRENKKKKYGKFSCRPNVHLRRNDRSFLVSVCSRVSDPSLNVLNSIVRVSSLDFSRPAIVAKLELNSFSSENSEKLILNFISQLEEANEPEQEE